jgi:hypothetical protein
VREKLNKLRDLKGQWQAEHFCTYLSLLAPVRPLIVQPLATLWAASIGQADLEGDFAPGSPIVPFLRSRIGRDVIEATLVLARNKTEADAQLANAARDAMARHIVTAAARAAPGQRPARASPEAPSDDADEAARPDLRDGDLGDEMDNNDYALAALQEVAEELPDHVAQAANIPREVVLDVAAVFANFGEDAPVRCDLALLRQAVPVWTERLFWEIVAVVPGVQVVPFIELCLA